MKRNRTYSNIKFISACLVAAACLAPGSARAGETVSPLGAEQMRATGTSLVGEWTASVGSRDIAFALSGNGRYTLEGAEGAYSVSGDTLKLTPAGGKTVEYKFRLDKAALVLSGGDLSGDMKFVRSSGISGLIGWVFDVARESATLKAWRLLTPAGKASPGDAAPAGAEPG